MGYLNKLSIYLADIRSGIFIARVNPRCSVLDKSSLNNVYLGGDWVAMSCVFVGYFTRWSCGSDPAFQY